MPYDNLVRSSRGSLLAIIGDKHITNKSCRQRNALMVREARAVQEKTAASFAEFKKLCMTALVA